MRTAIFLILISAVIVSAQVAPPATSKPAPQATTPATPTAPPVTKPEDVPLTAAVITIHGVCPDKPAGTDPNSEDCKTVVTRGEFEKLANTLSPVMPGSAKQQLAAEYSRMLVFGDEARKLGLEKSQRFRDLMAFVQLQVLAREMQLHMQEKAKPSAAEVENFYKQNPGRFEELSVSRIFIPRSRPADGGAETKQATDDDLKAQAEKARARVAAGESFEQVQKDVYEAAGFKTPPPPTSIPNWRKEALSPEQQQLFNMKPGELSQPMLEGAGVYIYRVDDRKPVPFEQAKSEIETQLTNERMKQQVDAISTHVKADVNQPYFRALTAADQGAGAPPPAGATRAPAAASPGTAPAKSSNAGAATGTKPMPSTAPKPAPTTKK
ncbi:MAG TPA: peptidylprolyl isomerase [Terriglobales bacterium]|nr:peptidylprolyl isomerase [Terriglobales bacterium]